MNFEAILLAVLSPTYAVADAQKRDLGRSARARLIRRRNRTYLIVGIALAIATFALTWRGAGYPNWRMWWPVL